GVQTCALPIYREGRVEIVGQGLAFESLQYFDQDVDGYAVVERLAVDAGPHGDEIALAGDRVADIDRLFDLFDGSSRVDEVVFDLGWFVFLVRAHQVDGLAAHDAHDLFAAVDDDALGGERLRIEAPERVEAHEAFVVDMGDDKADLIHVRGHHDALVARAA